MPVWPCSTPPMTVRTTTTVRKTLMRPVRAWRSPGPAGARPDHLNVPRPGLQPPRSRPGRGHRPNPRKGGRLAHRIRIRRRRGRPGGFVASAAAAGLILAVAVHGHHSPGLADTAAAAPGKPAAEAIAYARAELGKPYLWGGTGP